MENLTPGQIAVIVIGAVLAVAGAVNTIGSAVEKLFKIWRAAKAPNNVQNDRLDALEEWRVEVDRKQTRDNNQLKALQCGLHAIYRANLALLDHGLDGNNIEQMKSAKEELLNQLIDK